MRLLATLAVILGMIIGLALWFNHSLQASADDLSRQIEHISAEIKEERWEAAMQEGRKLEKNWEGKAKWWPIFLDHQEIDNIEFSLSKAKEYVDAGDYSLSLGQLSELKLMIEHIPRKEAVTLKNIL